MIKFSTLITGNSTDGSKLKEIIMEIIHLSENCGLKVDSITFDMGPNNMSMLKRFGISVVKKRNKIQVNNKIIHPCDASRFLYFFCDVPHVEKNLATGWRKCRKIKLSTKLCEKYNFPTDSIIDIDLVRSFSDLVNIHSRL